MYKFEPTDLYAIREWANGANKRNFVNTFGEHAGPHLWEKFNAVDFLTFISELDRLNIHKLAEDLTSAKRRIY